MSNATIINAPLTVNVADAAGITGALVTARPGTIINLTTTVSPFSLSIPAGTEKAGMGVFILLPQAQKFRLAATGVKGVSIIGGTGAADEILGTTASNNYTVELNNCERVGVYGTIFDQAASAVRMVGGTDFAIENCVMDKIRNDSIGGINARRIRIRNNRFLAGIVGEKFCHFNDGRNPVEGISEDACTALGGRWIDTGHADDMQLRSAGLGNHCRDLTITDNFMTGSKQCIVNFGADGPDYWERVLIARNNLSLIDAVPAIYSRGMDTEVIDNVVTIAPNGLTPRIFNERLNVSDRIRAGRNVAPGFTGPTVGAANVVPDGPTVTGDVVLPPVLPNLHVPQWAMPFISRPADPQQNIAPYWVESGGIVWYDSPTPPVAGMTLSIRRGRWAGYIGATWAFTWLRNGTPIGGQTQQRYVLQVGVDVPGTVITATCQGTNATGTGPVKTYDAVTVA